MNKSLLLVAALGCTVLGSGCVSTVDGRRAVGVPLMKDKIYARYERQPAELWNVAKEVLRQNGTLTSEDTLKATLQASVDNKTVWVRIDPIDQKITQITVQVRTKGGAADLQLASDLDKQIALRLQGGSLPPAPRTISGS